MPVDEFIIHLFCIVDETIGPVKKRRDAKLYPSEIVTIGLLFACKGGHFSRFYRWLAANYRHFFPRLPEHSRMARLVRDYAEFTEDFLVTPTFFTILDTYGIELIHPRREGRSEHSIAEKGVSNGRWIVGIKIAWLLDDQGRIVDWAWDTASAPDNVFRAVALTYDEQTITLCDNGLRETGAPQQNMKYCDRGTWNERFTIETNFSWITEAFNSKKMHHRTVPHLTARLGYLAALVNCLLRITNGVRSIKQFVL